MSKQQRVLLRDLVIFQLKLALDGLKDLVLSPVAIAAVVIDLVLPGRSPGDCFYAVMRAGERFDRWLSLYDASVTAGETRDGLFGASRAGANSMLGKLESMVLGHDEPETDTRQRAAA